MSFLSNPQNVNFGTVNQSTNKQSLTWRFYVSSGPAVHRQRGDWGIGKAASPSRTENDSYDNNGVTHTLYCNDSATVDCDETYYYDIKGTEYDSDYTTVLWSQTKSGSSKTLGKSDAATPVLDDAPTLDNATTTTIRVNNALGDSFTPKTSETSVTLYIQYKVTGAGDETYANFSALNSSVTGYTDTAIGTDTVTGLTADTSYTFRYHLDRTGTSNGTTSYYSGESTLSTIPDVPDVTTNAATNVTAGVSGVPNDGAATLNATVDRNGKTDLEWRFAYEETPTGGTYANATAWTASTAEPESVQLAIGSLTESDEYGYRVEVRWNSGADTDEGSEVTFTVPGDPLATAEDEDRMKVYEFDRKYGVATTVWFMVPDVATSSSDRFLTTVPATLFTENADIRISKDGAAFADLDTWNPGTTSPLQITAGEPLYSIPLTATEMEANEIDIVISDNTGTAAFRDTHIRIRTELQLGNVDIDAATGTKDDTTAFKVTGYGAGHGIEAVRGATGYDIQGVLERHVIESGTFQATPGSSSAKLASTANANNDVYNGDILVAWYSATGENEQARLIADYDGSTKVATVDSAWIGSNPTTGDKYIILPGQRVWNQTRAAELSSVPTATGTYGDKLQMLYQRFAYKVDQTATQQTWYKSTGTSYATKTVSDDGTTQILGALT